jgi:hypothetical protein
VWYNVFGGHMGWHERAINEARSALGDQRYQSLAAEGATVALETFVDEMIANLDQYIAGAGAQSPAHTEETSA